MVDCGLSLSIRMKELHSALHTGSESTEPTTPDSQDLRNKIAHVTSHRPLLYCFGRAMQCNSYLHSTRESRESTHDYLLFLYYFILRQTLGVDQAGLELLILLSFLPSTEITGVHQNAQP